jgi:hypothetical protein
VKDIGLGFRAKVYPHGPRHFSFPTAHVQDLHRSLNLHNPQNPFIFIIFLKNW